MAVLPKMEYFFFKNAYSQLGLLCSFSLCNDKGSFKHNTDIFITYSWQTKSLRSWIGRELWSYLLQSHNSPSKMWNFMFTWDHIRWNVFCNSADWKKNSISWTETWLTAAMTVRGRCPQSKIWHGDDLMFDFQKLTVSLTVFNWIEMEFWAHNSNNLSKIKFE